MWHEVTNSEYAWQEWRKEQKTSQGRWSSGQDFNQRPHKYEAGVLHAPPKHSTGCSFCHPYPNCVSNSSQHSTFYYNNNTTWPI